ncbi:iron complex transport system permease protein [Haloferula luteola]|uniref:Iron complex transport system permease protein n=1 Tax=Haloferula luteola TaxID=595692 RepID=A0A840VAK6_9BACT|nr:iron ABC transporter permease [Haloferula luteola]MBB5352584.1 iron complex transport system permease protein [Haloferula luteola]
MTERRGSPRRNLIGLAIGSSLLILLAGLAQLAMGSYEMTRSSAAAALSDPAVWAQPNTLARLVLGDALANAFHFGAAAPLSTETLIVWNVRLPRLLAALFVGINLSLAGTILQAVTRNEMASPYLLGMSSGAGLAVILVLVLFPAFSPAIPAIAMLGGGAAFLLVYAIAWNRGTSPVRLVLAGVVIASIAGSLQTALFFMAKDLTVIQNAMAWTTGSLTGTGWVQVRQIAPWTLVSLVLGLSATRQLDVLHLGEATALSLGMRVERVRFLLAAIAVIATGAAVAVAGLIGFVGLIVPHIVRSLVGSSHRRLLLGCAIAGPALLLTADAVARLLLSPVQLPVGIVTGCLGGIFFLFLMRRRRHFGKP